MSRLILLFLKMRGMLRSPSPISSVDLSPESPPKWVASITCEAGWLRQSPSRRMQPRRSQERRYATKQDILLGGLCSPQSTHHTSTRHLFHGSDPGHQTEAIERAVHILPSRFKARHPVSYTHLRAHETVLDLVCRLLL